VFWTLTVVVSLKYVVLILRADNHGEGGLIAMLALASQAVKDRPGCAARLLLVGIFGTACSSATASSRRPCRCWAVEGLEVAARRCTAGGAADAVVLTGLFMVQRFGTAVSGAVRAGHAGVVCVLAVLGASHMCCTTRRCWWRCQPHHALGFMWRTPASPSSPGRGGAVRDRRRGAVRRPGPLRQAAHPPGLVRLVMPALVLNYFGQGAMLLAHPENVKQPLLRDGARLGAVPADRAGHAATVIASQALITAPSR
jgi:KUP system potassium uptake protein